jgi:eukaryotic-like serine/threonine-protein kinase
MRYRLGKYLLTHRLNQGGTAEVYLAKAFGFEGADQILALKCIRPEFSADATFVSMFVEEAKLSVILSHQNIARIFELGKLGDRYFIAMENVFGRDLRALLDRLLDRGESATPLSEELALHVVAQVCEGLDYAHRKTGPTGEPLNIVHRDVSPQNVLCGYDGAVKLIDFGIAKAMRQGSASHSRVLRGKYGYMSPEQVRGYPLDARSDVFAVGVLLFELLTGQRLFTGGSEHSILDKVRHAEILPPSMVSARISADSDAVVLRALAQDPRDRYQSASDMRDAVVQLLVQNRAQSLPRKLAALLAELFAEDIERDRVIIEETRRITEMPADAAPLAAEVSKPGASDTVRAAREITTRVEVPGSNHPTQRLQVSLPEIEPRRTAVILGAAAALAVCFAIWAAVAIMAP